MTSLLIIGAGLTGLFAAVLAARRGASVTLVARGRGNLELSHGCIDVWKAGTPLAQIIDHLPDTHPYKLVGFEAVQAALAAFCEMTAAADYPFTAKPGGNLLLPTALGTIRTTAYAPPSLAQGDMADRTPFVLAGLSGFRDFYPALAASALERAGLPVKGVLELPIPGAPVRRDAYATDLAYLFDKPANREQITRLWKPLLNGVERLGLPAVLGLRQVSAAFWEMQERLSLPLFEIPTLPPSIPGLRLERMLRRAALDAGVQIVEGVPAVGQTDGGRRVAGVVVESAGRSRFHTADAVLLATGDILGGGLEAGQDGHVRETVFDLPVVHDTDRAGWTNPALWDEQPFERFGLRVDKHMRPLDADGKPIYDNLYAAGSLLTGADRINEGSRQGIALATAFRAVEAVLG
jgi:glycerol-3-phosphate dehydrogenase subunit B